ncbi:MAG: hypothetical protein ABI867_15115 [Kofleriaceae bacterium]
MNVFLLPLLGAGITTAQPVVVTSGTHEIVERGLNQGIRARIEKGWAVADMRTELDEFVVTMVRGDAVERHVMHVGGAASYRLESDAALPADPIPPDDTMLRVLASARGGFEVLQSCGDYYTLPYFVQDTATGADAGALVARTLATADDLLSVSTYDHRATFLIEKGTRLTLRVWLDEGGKVLEAELRRLGGEPDPAMTYKRMPTLKSFKSTRVLSIDIEGRVLKTLKGTVELDPKGNAFANEDGGEYEGCGC